MAVVSYETSSGSGRSFRTPDQKMESQNEKVHLLGRNDIHIIDLQQTIQLAEEAYNFVREIAAEGNSVLFVGTKAGSGGD